MPTLIEVPAGLEGVIAAETSIGDVRGEEGFYHYRQYSAVDLAAARSFEDVWYLMIYGDLPDHPTSQAFARRVAGLRDLPPALAALLGQIAFDATPLDVLRTAYSLLGAQGHWAPSMDLAAEELEGEGLIAGAVAPTILAAAWRLQQGSDPIGPRADLGHAANYLWMLTGREADPAHVRALEQYLITTIDHGFNASTFAARVITSTGADMAAALVGAVGALSGPLHGGAPSRALAMLDAIARPEAAEKWVREAVMAGDRIMGFGHRVYKTDDPRSVFMREVAQRLGGDLPAFAVQVEQTVIDVLAELKPGRRLYTNVEFYAGVVMHACGIPREMFTPTFASSRTIGWVANILEQAAHNRLIRPTARYVGPPAPAPVPAAA
jgi:citrate synthase